jgi:hypothetical protein
MILTQATDHPKSENILTSMHTRNESQFCLADNPLKSPAICPCGHRDPCNNATDAPEPGHAEIVVRPRPVPRAVRTTPRARAANAPAMIAAQLTADDEASLPRAVVRGAEPATTVAMNQCQISARRMMIGIGTPSSQSRIPRPIIVSSSLSRRLLATASQLAAGGHISLSRYELRRKRA